MGGTSAGRRAEAGRLLRGLVAHDDAERTAVRRALRLLAAHEDALDRTCAGPGHLTASSVVVNDGSVLLTLHPKFGRWMQLGGHVEPEDGSLAAAAERETREESGLATFTLDPVPLGVGAFDHIPCPTGRTSTHFDVRFLVHAPSRQVVPSDESLDLAWWPLAALPSPHDADLALLAHQALTRSR